MVNFPYISGDSHLEIHPKNWTDRVPAQHRDRAPRVTRLADGSDAWLIEGAAALRISWGDVYGGRGREDVGRVDVMTYDNTPGTGSPEQRLREQDEDGIAAEVLFPGQQTGPRLWRSIADNDAYLSVIQAWNSFLAEDYCSVNPDRLIGLGVMPWTNADDCVAELERCAKLGFKGVVMGVFPNGKGYPTPEDDKFWAAAVDMQMPVSVHVEFDRRGPRAGTLFRYPNGTVAQDGFGGGIVGQLANPRFGMMGANNAAQLIFAGVFDRFPKLQVFWAENQIGWLPHFLEQADELYEWHKYAGVRNNGMPILERPPSTYLREHSYWGFQYNPVGVRNRHEIGLDKLIWATDFPHQGSEYPNTRTKVLDRNFPPSIPEEDTYRMVCGNVCEFFHLDEAIYRE